MFCFKFNHDRTWEVIVTDISLNPDNCSYTKRLEVKLILSSLDNMQLCCGNNDAKYDILLVNRKVIFMDQLGM